ncbi:hypothetical protein NJ76_15430, partial [Rhodococcus sp. IITR03]
CGRSRSSVDPSRTSPARHRPRLPLARAYAGLLGGALLVLADVVGRIVVRPGELQVGIVLASSAPPSSSPSSVAGSWWPCERHPHPLPRQGRTHDGHARSPVQVSTRVPGRPAFRLGSVSVVWRARMVIVCALIVVATAVLLSISLGRGDYPLSPLQVVEVLLGGGERLDRFIVFDLRLPRGVAAVVVGA